MSTFSMASREAASLRGQAPCSLGASRLSSESLPANVFRSPAGVAEAMGSLGDATRKRSAGPRDFSRKRPYSDGLSTALSEASTHLSRDTNNANHMQLASVRATHPPARARALHARSCPVTLISASPRPPATLPRTFRANSCEPWKRTHGAAVRPSSAWPRLPTRAMSMRKGPRPFCTWPRRMPSKRRRPRRGVILHDDCRLRRGAVCACSARRTFSILVIRSLPTAATRLLPPPNQTP